MWNLSLFRSETAIKFRADRPSSSNLPLEPPTFRSEHTNPEFEQLGLHTARTKQLEMNTSSAVILDGTGADVVGEAVEKQNCHCKTKMQNKTQEVEQKGTQSEQYLLIVKSAENAAFAPGLGNFS